MHQISALPQTLIAGFNGPTSKGEESMGREGGRGGEVEWREST